MKECNMINLEVRDINCRNVKEDNFFGVYKDVGFLVDYYWQVRIQRIKRKDEGKLG